LWLERKSRRMAAATTSGGVAKASHFWWDKQAYVAIALHANASGRPIATDCGSEFKSVAAAGELSMWEVLFFLLDLLSLGALIDPKRRTTAEASQASGALVERFRWVIYGMISLGILFLIVAVVAVLMAG
jgi:hypothetical protein